MNKHPGMREKLNSASYSQSNVQKLDIPGKSDNFLNTNQFSGLPKIQNFTSS